MTRPIPDTTQHRIDRFLKSARNARNAKNAVQRDAAQGFLIERAKELMAERETLTQRLDAGWDHLDRIGRSHPDHDACEDKLLTWVSTYEAIVDALEGAADIWAGEGIAA